MTSEVGALGTRARVRAYVALGMIQFRSVLMYRMDYTVGLIGVLLQVLLLSLVWTAVYAGRTEAPTAGSGPISLSTQIAYVTLAAVQYWLLNPWNLSGTADRIRTGKVAIDLARPIGFLRQVVYAKAGSTAAMMPFILSALPVAALIGNVEPPASVGAGFAYAASLLLAYLIATLLHTTVELLAFWTLELDGMFMVYRMVGQFCAGALVPLWFMPGWLRMIAEWLPFQATTYTPLAIYLGRISGSDVATALGVQAFWVLCVAGVLRLVWSRAERQVVVQGG